MLDRGYARPTAKSPSVFGKQVETRDHRVDTDGQDPTQTHICVSTMPIEGDSYRLREAELAQQARRAPAEGNDRKRPSKA